MIIVINIINNYILIPTRLLFLIFFVQVCNINSSLNKVKSLPRTRVAFEQNWLFSLFSWPPPSYTTQLLPGTPSHME